MGRTGRADSRSSRQRNLLERAVHY